MQVLLALCLLLAAAAPAEATVTIVSRATTLAGTQPVIKVDVNGNAVDAHDGSLKQFGDTFYLYGTAYACGYIWNTTPSTFCGFKVYTSQDMVRWTDRGYLYDASGSTWQTRCTTTLGCFRPHVVYNAANNNYVLWISAYDAGSQYRVFTSSSPLGPFIEQAAPTVGSGVPGNTNGDPEVFVDDDGTGYLVFTRYTIPGSGFCPCSIFIQQLAADYLTVTGSATDIGVPAISEAPSMTKQGSTYFILYAPTCPFGGSCQTYYKSASTPLGTWSAQTQINATSCGGQNALVSKLTIAGSPVYLYGSDIWNQDGASGGNGNANQGLAAHFWIPLSIASGTISTFTCDDSFTVGLTAQAVPTNPRVDQTSGTTGFSKALATSIYNTTNPRVQTFVAGANESLDAVLFMVAKGGVPCGSTCTPPNQPVTVDLVTVDGTGKPTAVLATASIPVASIAWAPTQVTAHFHGYPLTSGATYGIRVSSTYSAGAYAILYNDSATYPAGGEYVSSNSGSTYSLESGRALGFTILKFVRGLAGPSAVGGTGATQ